MEWEASSAAEYPDVNPGDWYYEYVQDVSDKGLMSGYTDTGKFGPSDKLTRGQFATILWRMAGAPEVAYNGQFPDVSGNEFYGSAVAWASENGIIYRVYKQRQVWSRRSYQPRANGNDFVPL